MKSEPSFPTRRAFSFIELLVVLLLVSLWMSGAWVDVGKYLWLIEIPASLVWFILLYRALKWMIWDITAKRTFLWNIKSLIVLLFVLHIGVALLLRFGLHYSLFVSYPLSFAFGVILPLVTLTAVEKTREKRRYHPRLDARVILNLAQSCPPVKEFTRRYPIRAAYVFDHTRNHRVAACLFHHRRERPERADLFEDVLLEIEIDMRIRQALPDQTRITRYLFQPYQDGSILMELVGEAGDEKLPLSQETLLRFDQILNRFPSLADDPLPIALHRGPIGKFENTS
ncbi:MAG: hypothetical protein ACE15F_01425 [bacterium]